MAVSPPERRIWWNEPIERVELIWIVIAFLWGLFMFAFMIAWHFIGQQNLNKEAVESVAPVPAMPAGAGRAGVPKRALPANRGPPGSG